MNTQDEEQDELRTLKEKAINNFVDALAAATEKASLVKFDPPELFEREFVCNLLNTLQELFKEERGIEFAYGVKKRVPHTVYIVTLVPKKRKNTTRKNK